MATDTRLMTAAELLALPDDGDRYELLDGVLVQMAPAGWGHNALITEIATRLHEHCRRTGAGRVLSGDAGVLLRRNPDRVRAPDVCFIAGHRLPDGRLPRGYSEIVPDLIVEIVAPNDRAAAIQAKTQEWLTAGARLVWLVFPDPGMVLVYQPGGLSNYHERDDLLTGEPVLPGFSVRVSDLFV
jgi:Uma2 family endonuclease